MRNIFSRWAIVPGKGIVAVRAAWAADRSYAVEVAYGSTLERYWCTSAPSAISAAKRECQRVGVSI
jgi:hypothetical protein